MERPVPNPPHPLLPEYYTEQRAKQTFLNDLFDHTAAYYQQIDKVTAFGSGSWYRRQALIGAGLKPGMQILDVACGTGLVTVCAQSIVGPQGLVVGLDPSTGMLREARRASCPHLIRGVSDALPFANASFDFISMGYALRHVSDLTVTFQEYLRVLKPGGALLLLELGPPRSKLFRTLARFYIREIVGRLFHYWSGDRTLRQVLRYWWDTSEQCVDPEVIMQTFQRSGFSNGRLIERFNGLLREYVAVNGNTFDCQSNHGTAPEPGTQYPLMH